MNDIFTPWQDPVSGITSHILTRRAAPLQQSFYFTNRSMWLLRRNGDLRPLLGDGAYHLDPHPQFCAGDRFIVYTATVRGCLDVALVRTADLLDATT